jgi:GT2 family glycosyltransferase
MPTQVTFLVPIRSEADLHLESLRSLVSQNRVQTSILVLGMGSGSTTPAILAEVAADVPYLVMPSGVSPGEALNRGVMVCETPLFAVVDPGIVLDPGWASALVDAIGLDLNTYMANGPVMVEKDSAIIEAIGEVVDELGNHHVLGNEALRGTTPTEPVEISAPYSACALFRRRLFSHIGPIDGAFRAGSEIADVSMRARWHGFKALYVPSAVAYRRTGSPPPPTPDRTAADHDRMRLFFKCMPGPLMVANAPRVMAGPISTLSPREFLRGMMFLLGFLRAFPGLMSRRREVRAQAIVEAEFLYMAVRGVATTNPLARSVRWFVTQIVGPYNIPAPPRAPVDGPKG